MPRRPSHNPQKMIGCDCLLDLFVAKFKNYDEAEKTGGMLMEEAEWLLGDIYKSCGGVE